MISRIGFFVVLIGIISCRIPRSNKALINLHFQKLSSKVLGNGFFIAGLTGMNSKCCSDKICACKQPYRACCSDLFCLCAADAQEADGGNWYNPLNERIYDTHRKTYLPAAASQRIDTELEKYQRNIVVIGEVHSNPCHHRVEFDVIRSLHHAAMSKERSMAIGLECFYRNHQAALDRK